MFVFPPYGSLYRQTSCRRYGGRAGLQEVSEHRWDGWIAHLASEQSTRFLILLIFVHSAAQGGDGVCWDICLLLTYFI